MDLNGGTEIGPEDMDQIEEAISELARFELPRLWVGEPTWEEAGCVGPHMSYLWAEQNGYHRALAGEHQTELYDLTVHILAAKKELVTVKKNQPGHEFDDTEALMMKSIRYASCTVVSAGYYHGTVDSEGWKPRSEDWIEENTVVVIDFPPDEISPAPLTVFYRFVPKTALTSKDLPYIEEFVDTSQLGEPEGYSVPKTEPLLLAANVFSTVSQL